MIDGICIKSLAKGLIKTGVSLTQGSNTGYQLQKLYHTPIKTECQSAWISWQRVVTAQHKWIQSPQLEECSLGPMRHGTGTLSGM